MASAAEIVARLTLNARDFKAKFQTAVDDAASGADKAGKKIGAAFGDSARGGLDDLAARIPVVGSALAGLGGGATLAAAGVGALVIGITAAIGITEQYEQQARQLDAVLKATGNSTGLSSQQLKDYAEELESTFAISAETFLQAETTLSSFGGVAGSTFKRALTSAADLAAVYGGDLPGNAEKLGVVLQNLAQGNVEGLTKGFKFLGTAQLDVIQRLAEAGDAYQAQIALLKALEDSIGGAGAARSKGTAGALYRISDALEDSSRALVTNSGLYQTVIDYLDKAADAAGTFANALDRIGDFKFTADVAKALNDADARGGTGPLAQLQSGYRRALVQTFYGVDYRTAKPEAAAGKDGSVKFPGALGSDFVEVQSAAAATRSAKAEGDAQRAREAADAAAKRRATEAEKAVDAARREAEQREKLGKALEGEIAKYEQQAQLVGQTKEESALVTREAELQLKYGNLFNDALRKRLVLATSLEGLLTTGKTELEGSFKANATTALPGGQSLDAYFKHQLDDFERGRKEVDDQAATRAREQERIAFDFADHFRTALLGGVDAVRAQFEDDLGTAISTFAGNIAASFAGGGNGDVAVNAKALAESAKTAGIEFVLAAALRPLEPAIGAVAGGISKIVEYTSPLSLLQKLILGSHDEAFQTVTSSGVGTLGGVKGANGGKAAANARTEAGSAFQSLQNLADQFGAYLKPGVNLGAVGSYDGKFSFDTTPGSGRNRQLFDTQEEAIIAFLRNAVKQDALTGLDPTVIKLLSTGVFNEQLPKAAKLQAALKEFNGGNDAVTSAVAELNKQFRELADIMAEAGVSTEETAKASAYYETKLQAIRDAAGGAASTLKAFLDDLGFGSASALSLRDQEAAARGNYAAKSALIGTAGFDQSAFVAAGQRLIDIEGQINGRTGDFFAVYNQVQADTERAIAAINSAITVQGDNPFARATADATAATAGNTSVMAETLQAILAQLAAGGFGGGGGGAAANDRGFVAKAA